MITHILPKSNTRSYSVTTMAPTKKYRIVTQGPNGSHMVATQTIPRGTLILTETTILEIPVGRRERFNENEFWSAGNCSGAKQLTYEYGKASSNRRNKFDQLHFCRIKDAVQLTSEKGEGDALQVDEWERLNKAQTNAFERTYRDDKGVEKIIFDVFDEISRINHACSPNAAYYWDGERDKGRGRGVVHALTKIDENQEITLCYPKDLEFVFYSGQRRRAELDRNWNFICNCVACTIPPGQTAPADDQQRQALSTLHTDLKFVEPPKPRRINGLSSRRTISGDTHTHVEEQQEHVQLHREITGLTLFANDLAAIGVKDERLCDA